MDYSLPKLHKPKTGSDWYVYYTFRNPDTGAKVLFKERDNINRLKSVAEKKEHGAKKIDEINIRLRSGWSPFSSSCNPHAGKNLVEVLNDILAIKNPTLRPRSVQHYKYCVDLITGFVSNKQMLPEHFTPIMAQEYSDFLILEKKYTPGTHNNQVSLAKILFNAMIDREIILKNPFRKIKNKLAEEGRLLSYSKIQKQVIRDYTRKSNHPMYMFAQWIYYCFIRPAELMQVQVKHIDFENATIRIPANISKNRKNGIVAISDDFIPIIKATYEHLDPEYYLFAYGLKPGLKRVHRNRASASHSRLLKTLNISNDHILYDWKNTGARDFIISGKDPYALMAMMRHHSLDQTMVYLRSLGVVTGMKTDAAAWKF